MLAGPAASSRRAKAEFAHVPADVPDTVDELLDRATGHTPPRPVTLWAQNDLDGARIRRGKLALAAIRGVLGAEHLATLASINNLAETLSAHGDPDGARILHKQALAVFRQILDDDHQALASCRLRPRQLTRAIRGPDDRGHGAGRADVLRPAGGSRSDDNGRS
jgi:hypothetical protein